MKIEAKIICDSVCGNGKRITTMQLTYPRFIHAEFMTHRVFSRNASSSRAIPVNKMIQMANADPAFFVHIGSNQPGMQAGAEVDEQTKKIFKSEWEQLGRVVSDYVNRWASEYGIHKQVANRALEPWHHITVLVTATEWDNFFSLRCHKDAQPEMQALAEAMRRVYEEASPTKKMFGTWHLPFITPNDIGSLEEKIQMSVARCARVSYLNHDGSVPNKEKDIALYTQLVGSTPIHASPAEHQATPCGSFSNEVFCGNFVGWMQYRKFLEGNIDANNPM